MAIFAILNNDLVVVLGKYIQGVEVPQELSHLQASSLRFDGEKVVDVREQNEWLVETSEQGMPIKRHPSFYENSEFQIIKCAFDADLVQDDKTAVWRVKTDADTQLEAKDVAKKAVRISIDLFKGELLGKYTDTEQQGWSVLLPQAQKFIETGEEADAPSIVLRAAGDIRKRTPKELAQGIVIASKITALLPDLASVIRSNANYMIDATDGTAEAIKAVTELLEAKQTAIALAIQSGDQKVVLAAATTGWEV